MRILLTVLFIFSALVLSVANISAKVIAEERGAIEILPDEVINDDLFLGGEMIQIEGTVNGDVYAGAETVRVSGTINGDLHTGAGMVVINGKVTEDVYIGAGEVTISNATIGDSLIIGAGNIHIDKESSIGGSLIVGTGALSLYSPVGRNLIAGAGKVDLNAEITGEANIGAGEVNVGPDTRIGKDFNYAVEDESTNLRISETASIAGQTKRHGEGWSDREVEAAKKGAERFFEGLNLVASILSFLGALLVGYLLLRFFPTTITEPSVFVKTNFLKTLGVGFLICVFIIPALLALVVTGVGIPLAGILFLVFLLSLYFTKFVVAYALGEWIPEKVGWKKLTSFKLLLTGLIAIYILKMIPIIGFLTSLVVVLSGLGALFLYYRDLLTRSSRRTR